MRAQQSITQIAELLGRDKSTISREVRRSAAQVFEGITSNSPVNWHSIALSRNVSASASAIAS